MSTLMWIVTWGVVAVVWVITMVLAAWFTLNFNPDTSNMPVWKAWGINAFMIVIMIYTLPLLAVIVITDLIYLGLCKLGEKF